MVTSVPASAVDEVDEAARIADRVETVISHINDQPLNDDPHGPFGGMQKSGFGRYNVDSILDEMTTKWMSTQREPQEYPF